MEESRFNYVLQRCANQNMLGFEDNTRMCVGGNQLNEGPVGPMETFWTDVSECGRPLIVCNFAKPPLRFCEIPFLFFSSKEIDPETEITLDDNQEDITHG